MLGIALAMGLVAPFIFQQSRVIRSSRAQPQSVLSTDSYRNARLSKYSPLRAPLPVARLDDDLNVLGDFVRDGVEFTLAGAELSNQFGAYREVGNTIAWFAQALSQPENASPLASQQATRASLVALTVAPSPESEMASRLLKPTRPR